MKRRTGKRRTGSGLRWMALVLAMAGQASLFPRASAESVEAPAVTLTVSPEIAVQPGVDAPIDARVESSEGRPPQCMLIVKGLPAGAVLSEGKSFSDGQWVVPMASLGKLKVRTPKPAVISLQLFNLDGQKLAERQVALAAPQRSLTPEEKAFAQKLVDRGAQNLRTGNVIVAREFFLSAAERGLAEGAMALGATYDPRELARSKIGAAAQPDVELARKWYEAARRLGSEEADARLKRLSGEAGG